MVRGELAALLVTVTEPVTLPAAEGANVTMRVAASDGFSVTGAVKPLTEYPAPLAVIAEMVAAAFPVLVITTCCLALVPVATVPKFRLVVLALNCPVATAVPVPVSGMFRVGLLGSLLVMAILPLAAPATVGEKVTTACTDCPALIVFGVVIPLIPNSLPVNVIRETVKSADPVLLRVRLALPLSPLESVPKLIEVGDTDNCGCDAATAVADRFATTGELPPSPLTVSVPVIFPAADGVTLTEKFPDCPAGSDMGNVTPERLN
jgi:hypothetical protein